MAFPGHLKTYRLPTEAEWELLPAEEQIPFFFEGQIWISAKRIFRKTFGKSSDLINDYVIYEGNSKGKTEEPDVGSQSTDWKTC